MREPARDCYGVVEQRAEISHAADPIGVGEQQRDVLQAAAILVSNRAIDVVHLVVDG